MDVSFQPFIKTAHIPHDFALLVNGGNLRQTAFLYEDQPETYLVIVKQTYTKQCNDIVDI